MIKEMKWIVIILISWLVTQWELNESLHCFVWYKEKYKDYNTKVVIASVGSVGGVVRGVGGGWRLGEVCGD